MNQSYCNILKNMMSHQMNKRNFWMMRKICLHYYFSHHYFSRPRMI
jgi:hypothetical protein